MTESNRRSDRFGRAVQFGRILRFGGLGAIPHSVLGSRFPVLGDMKFLVLIYNDPKLLQGLSQPEFDATMRDCLAHADELRSKGKLLDTQMLEDAPSARSVRVRKGRTTTHDGPFAETKEVLGGFNLIEAKDMAEAVKIASEFPWASTGCVEVRPVRDVASVRQRVGG
jgi:hypothetical protein